MCATSSAFADVGAGWALRQQYGGSLTVAALSSRTAVSCIIELTFPSLNGHLAFSKADAPERAVASDEVGRLCFVHLARLRSRPRTIQFDCGSVQLGKATAEIFERVIEMPKNPHVVLYVLVLIAVVVSVDLLFFKNRFWERLIVNIGIVLVFAAFYLRFLK